MKLNKWILAAGCLLTGSLFSACEETISLDGVDNDKLVEVGQVRASLESAVTTRPMQVIEVYAGQPTQTTLRFNLSRAAEQIVDLELKVDESLVTAYNQANETAYTVYPAEYVQIENDGKIAIAPGDYLSDEMVITLSHSAANDLRATAGNGYLLPITLVSHTEGVDVIGSKQSYLFVVKLQGNRPNAAKESGIITNMYFEVGDTNILNAGEWTLKDSGKPMADIVCIFAANIKYNADEKRVYLFFNKEVNAILNNRDHYIKPLQDKGIKVTLSILGDHDAAGVANLDAGSCKAFARILKATVDAYGLDGVEFDDEWSAYADAIGKPGFVYPESADAMARLCYETKRLMPDKVIGVYHYGAAMTGFRNQIEGMDPGDFVDYTYEATYDRFNMGIWSAYRGMTKKQNAPYSRKINQGLAFDDGTMRVVRDEYGVNMLYNYQTSMVNLSYKRYFSLMTQILYDEECVFSGISHPKDY